MTNYRYLIVGGGVAGISALHALKDLKKDSLLLLEARDEPMYTLTWMRHIPFGRDGYESTGFDFRKSLMARSSGLIESGDIRLGTRVFNIDLSSRTVYARSPEGERLSIKYDILIFAAGATQIVYGESLLPGVRPGRLFSVYQVGEMLAHYDFLPGRRLVLYGASVYTAETAISASRKGIKCTVVSPGDASWKVYARAESINLYENCILKQVLGDASFSGLLVQQGSNEFCVRGDSLAVDGDYVLEHVWREHLGVEWNLEEWRVDLRDEEMMERKLIFLGDARKPEVDFVKQYEQSQQVIRRLLG